VKERNQFGDIMIFKIPLSPHNASLDALQRWSREFGPVVKVDQLVREMIQNDETKEPFARFQGQGCA
jgi:hypothetical protein